MPEPKPVAPVPVLATVAVVESVREQPVNNANPTVPASATCLICMMSPYRPPGGGGKLP